MCHSLMCEEFTELGGKRINRGATPSRLLLPLRFGHRRTTPAVVMTYLVAGAIGNILWKPTTGVLECIGATFHAGVPATGKISPHGHSLGVPTVSDAGTPLLRMNNSTRAWGPRVLMMWAHGVIGDPGRAVLSIPLPVNIRVSSQQLPWMEWLAAGPAWSHGCYYPWPACLWVKLRPREVMSVRHRESREGVGISMLDPRSMLDVKVMFLEQHLPAGILTIEVSGLHQPDQGLVVGDQAELRAVQMVPERAI